MYVFGYCLAFGTTECHCITIYENFNHIQANFPSVITLKYASVWGLSVSIHSILCSYCCISFVDATVTVVCRHVYLTQIEFMEHRDKHVSLGSILIFLSCLFQSSISENVIT